MFTPDENGVYARVSASPIRRLVAYIFLTVLGILLIYMALFQPPPAHWLVFLLAMGATTLWVAEKLRLATQLSIELTETELRDSNGRILASLGQVKGVDRGAFAMKPSNGFTVILTEKGQRAWAPGLWWRIGRRVGVGGVTSAAEAKLMAEQIALRIQSAR